MQYGTYASLRPDAETAGLLYWQNGQLHDVPGRTQSPYQTQVLFAAAPSLSYSATGSVSFVPRRNLYVTSGTAFSRNTTVSLSLDFDDGRGYVPAAWDQPVSATYATVGTKRIRVQATYKDRRNPFAPLTEVRYSWFDFEVLAVPVASRYSAGYDQPFAATWLVGNAARPDFTDHLGGTASIRYGLNHTGIVKPFIIIEGYNTARIAPHLVGKNNQDNTIEDFIRGIDRSSPFNFHESLEQAGYDLIYIDFASSTDDIRRNAALFEEVLRWVNQQKALNGSTEANVVMGQSMGGLVGRYGLARLVKTGYDPQVRLFILHDSPQRGANNPLGLQAQTYQADFIVYPAAFPPTRTSDLSDKLAEGLKILAAPATKQLSILNATNGTGGYEANTFIDGPYKDMITFPAGGPQPAYQIIATSDGSQCGQPQNTAPHTELSRTNNDYLLLPFWMRGGIGIQSEAVTNALPAYGTTERIAHLRVWFRIKILFAKIDVTLLNRNYSSPPNTLPYETLPGGNENLVDQADLLGNYGNGFLGFWRFAMNTNLYNGDICFVPSYSALDVEQVTPTTAFARYIGGVTDNAFLPRIPRFIANENAFGTRYNLPHLRFTARNAEWLFREMQNNQPGTVLCSALAECAAPGALPVTGPATLCGSGTYSLPIQGNGLTYSWTASPAYLFTTATGTGPTFTTSNAGSGQGTITVTVTGACSFTFTRSVNVGAPAPADIQATEIPDGCNTFGGSFQITNLDPALSYAVSVSGSLRLFGGFSASTGIIRVKTGAQRGPGYVTVTTTNACGSTSSTQTAEVTGCDFYTVYPNPAQEEATVVATEPAAAARATTAPEFEVALYNGQGRRVYQGRSQHGQAKLPLRELPAGLYQLHAGQGNRQERHTVQVRP